MNTIAEKIKKGSRTGERITGIMLIVFSTIIALSIISCTACLIVYLTNPDVASEIDNGLSMIGQEVSAGDVMISAGVAVNGYAPTTHFPQLMGYCLVILVCTSVFIISIMALVLTIFRKINQNGTPFVPGVSKKLKWIAWIMISQSIIIPFVTSVSGSLLSIVPGEQIGAAWELTGVFVGLICLFVATVFEYGCRLQADADTTL